MGKLSFREKLRGKLSSRELVLTQGSEREARCVACDHLLASLAQDPGLRGAAKVPTGTLGKLIGSQSCIVRVF